MDHYRTDLKPIIDDLMDRPGIKAGKSWGYPSYKAPNGKIFAFVGGNGLMLKFPVKRVKELIDEYEEVQQFAMNSDGTGVWKEWIIINHPDVDEYPQYQDLIDESMEYVMS
jgi:hypothetical protein